MTMFLVLDKEQAEILGFGLARAVTTQRKAMAEIMQERRQLAAEGDPNPGHWKQTRFNTLVMTVSRLNALIEKIDSTPDTADPLER